MENNLQENECCEITLVHKETLDIVKPQLEQFEILSETADIFKMLSDPTRLKIINALLISEMCACDISALLEMSRPAISHHLKSLKQTRIIKYKRKGKMVYYSLNDKHIDNIFKVGIAHAKENSQ